MPRFAAAVLFSTVTVFGAAHQIPTLRVVLDTDLGDDIDDTWALSALLQAMAGHVVLNGGRPKMPWDDA